MEILELILGGAGGGLLGSIMGYFKNREDRKKNKDLYTHQENMRRIDIEENASKREHEVAIIGKNIERAQAEGKIAQDIEDAKTFGKGVETMFAKSGVKWVDAFVSMMRPFITSYLLFLGTVIGFNVSRLAGGLESLPADVIIQLYEEIIMQVFFLLNACVLFWFNIRPEQKRK